MLKKIFWPKRDEIIRGMEIEVLKEENRRWYSSFNEPNLEQYYKHARTRI
jgi:hypothetical protein